MRGSDIDPALLLKCGSQSVGMITTDGGGDPTIKTDSSPEKQSSKPLFDLITDCDIEVGIHF